jgi:hypothetical protein
VSGQHDVKVIVVIVVSYRDKEERTKIRAVSDSSLPFRCFRGGVRPALETALYRGALELSEGRAGTPALACRRDVVTGRKAERSDDDAGS